MYSDQMLRKRGEVQNDYENGNILFLCKLFISLYMNNLGLNFRYRYFLINRCCRDAMWCFRKFLLVCVRRDSRVLQTVSTT